MRFHALAGLPRSGSTLLANVLSQHPDVHVSGTSALGTCIEAVSNVLSNAQEVQSDLANVPGAYDRYLDAMRGLISGWYDGVSAAHKFDVEPNPVVIDKGRGWANRRPLLEQLYPGSTLIVTVRDPRDVIASIIRQDMATAAFQSPIARTVIEQADLLLKVDGMVGAPLRFAEDLIRRDLPGVCWVRYESFTADPANEIVRVHDALGLEPFDHDFDDVANQATDLDALYRNKFPHQGSGTVKPSTAGWRDVFDEELAGLIAQPFPLFMRRFAYDRPARPEPQDHQPKQTPRRSR